MHEVSLCRNIVRMSEILARTQQASHISHVIVGVGALAALDTEALRHAFDVVSRDSLASEATLEIRRIAAFGRCQNCGLRAPMSRRCSNCPHCGATAMDLECGDELSLQGIEVLPGAPCTARMQTNG